MKYYYHATSYNNLGEILENGLKKSCDGVVYMCEKPEDCLKFVVFRALGMHEDILICKIKVYKRDEGKVIETFDHDKNFFQCKSYGYTDDIPAEQVECQKRIPIEVIEGMLSK